MNPKQIEILQRLHDENIQVFQVRIWTIKEDGLYHLSPLDPGITNNEYNLLSKSGFIDLVYTAKEMERFLTNDKIE